MNKKNWLQSMFLATVAALNLINAGATGIANLRSDEKAETRPTKSGKVGLAMETAALVAYAAAEIVDKRTDSPKASRDSTQTRSWGIRRFTSVRCARNMHLHKTSN